MKLLFCVSCAFERSNPLAKQREDNQNVGLPQDLIVENLGGVLML